MTKDEAVTLLIDEWSTIDKLLEQLTPQQWATPSALPGWSVQDVVSHIVGAELGLAGHQPPLDKDVRALPHVRNDIGALNEHWVESLRSASPAEVHRRFREITATRAETLQSMSEEDFHAPSWTPAGQDTYARFMRIRLFDCWMHEQDIRDAVGIPGNETGPSAETSLDEISVALGYIVGKRAAAPNGSSVTFTLNGPTERTIHVAVEGRAKVIDTLPRPATTSLTMSSTTFTRLTGGRIPVEVGASQTTTEGDKELADRVMFALPFTI
ncbi:uncharacterized protein (TIGR03083 family) [Kibdelosporangium banguiense]|uniref:Uncharacterized protein (TIGR03083 family) n=1 Tax=Kibdelosporangium banguiense TaxID=1365924 RepID=A0ABS4TLW3_9PSEU|nr:maleylpyruvate isomerase family mycothiol-dependent enzyme [Kibdelosporangium banguiense]MBP2325411.1 uncharacterized protein (TIGR03083 family) [Kibdelosporangium banguiense]